MLYLLFIVSLSLSLLYIFAFTNRESDRDFLNQYTTDSKIYDVLHSYQPQISEKLLLEASIKIDLETGKFNTDRYTMPILLSDLPKTMFNQILTRLGVGLDAQKEIIAYVFNELKNNTENSDVIFGKDGNILKIYTDNAQGQLSCLELDPDHSKITKIKKYQRTKKSQALKYSSILWDTPANYDNWKFVLKKTTNDHSPDAFHIYLHRPVKVADIYSKLPEKYLDHNVHWIAISSNQLNLYTRPS